MSIKADYRLEDKFSLEIFRLAKLIKKYGRIPKNLNISSKGLEIYKNNRYIALIGDVGAEVFFPIGNKLLDKSQETKNFMGNGYRKNHQPLSQTNLDFRMIP